MTPEEKTRAATAMKTLAPELGRTFGAYFQGLMKEGALPVKQKELIALGIAVAVHCEPCIEAHVKKCLGAGATPAEMMEAAGVGVMMGGGPAYTHAPLVAAAIERLQVASGNGKV
jgi:AhpD family alkylhydroperoxidase